MNQFQANDRIAKSCFKNYKGKAAIYLLLIVPFLCFEVMYNFHKRHGAFFSLLFAVLSVALFCVFIITIYNGVTHINLVLKKVQINGSQIIFETFGSSLLFNLVKKDPLVVSAERNQAIFSLSPVQYGFDVKYTGDIYLLSYGGTEYLVPEKFFDGFSELKAALENSNL